MQLNESTYETIFLLYIDKELSPKERMEVEAFIADNPSYALEMEALQATQLSSDKIQYPFKENLKQQAEISLDGMEEDWDKDWNATYATMLKADVEAIPGLSTSFKNSLKKETASEAIIVKSFGFNQQKFTYAAVAACLMVFFGYQQLTKSSVSDLATSNSIATNLNKELAPNISPITTTKSTGLSENIVSNSSKQTRVNSFNPVTKTSQLAATKLQASNSTKTQRSNLLQQESIVMAETTPDNSVLDNQAVMKEIPRTYNNPITINATPLAVSTANIDAESTVDEKGLTTYETIDTEDPNRTIYIANFEIDGNKFRGITRRVTSLFKNNKSERNK
ncbi:MAG: anti-sigma factor family protein [Sediminibacterium sp.]